MNIVLTGFMASGKTTISKAIAKISGLSLIDTDELLEADEGMTINEMFSARGEEYFRSREHEAIKKAAAMYAAVISTGGGAVLNKSNMTELRKSGIIFNLAPDFDVIKSRLEEAALTRPLLRNQNIADVKRRFDERRRYYDDCDYKIEIHGDKTPEEYAAHILSIFKAQTDK